jgi:GH15 family glucan-1,4-alpha-glucosidase
MQVPKQHVAEIEMPVPSKLVMGYLRYLSALVFAGILASSHAFASHLVTGNGFGFAVVPPESAAVTRFYAHPYSNVRPDPANALSEGIETTNFIKVLGWGKTPAQGASATYEEDSHIIRAHSTDGDGLIFMPFGLHHPALVVSWQLSSVIDAKGGLYVEWAHPVSSQKAVRVSGIEMHLLKFKDVPELLLLIPIGAQKGSSANPRRYFASSAAWVMISLENDSDLKNTVQDFTRWQKGLDAQALAKREIAEMEQWRLKPTVHFLGEKERHLWRQSEVMLRIAQSREPNRPGRNSNGLIVASLPDGVWFTPWVRDMAYAAVAFARMGHQEEARAAVMAYFNARPTGKMRAQTQGADYQISVVRYFGDGSEEPFFTMEGSTNIEFDNWGLALWVLGDYLKHYKDPGLLRTSSYRGQVYESARDFIVKPLIANLEKYGDGLVVAADTSIWEERQRDKKRFAFSTAAAIVGLRNFAETARLVGDEATRTQMLGEIALLQKGFNAAFIRGGKLHGTLEDGVKNDIDGALLAVINFGVVTDPVIVRDTVERMELLKVRSGGYRRVRCILTDPSIYEYWYERQEFLFVDLSLAEVYRRLGRDEEAASIFKRIVDKSAADHNVIPEMYVSESCTLFPGEVGDPTGAMPMVGYGAGAYILFVLQRETFESKH